MTVIAMPTWASKAVAYVGARVIGQGAEFLGWALLARNVPLADFGRISVAFLVARYLGLIADRGAFLRGPRDVVGRSEAEVLGLVSVRLRTGMLLTLAFVAVAVAIGQAQLAWLGICILSRAMVRDWIALGRGRSTVAAMPALIQGVTLALAALVASNALQASAAIASAYAAAAVASMLLNPVPRSSGTERVKPDGWTLLAVVAMQVLLSLDASLIAWRRSVEEAGIYAAVYRLSTAVMTTVGLFTTALVGPVTRSYLKATETERKTLARRAISTGMLVGAALLPLAPIAYFAVPIAFGEAFEQGRAAGCVLMVSAAANAMMVPILTLYFAAGKDRLLATSTTAVAFALIIADLVAIPKFGMNGAAAVSAVAQLTLWALLVTRIKGAVVYEPGRSR